MSRIATFLWFDTQAEEAANYYTSIFPNSKVTGVTRMPDGNVMIATFELDGQQFIALNGGPHFQFNEAISIYVDCQSQEEVDRLWDTLTAEGEESECGWLKDRYGLSWQLIPSELPSLLADPDPEKAARAMTAMRTMRKIDIKALRDARDHA